MVISPTKYSVPTWLVFTVPFINPSAVFSTWVTPSLERYKVFRAAVLKWEPGQNITMQNCRTSPIERTILLAIQFYYVLKEKGGGGGTSTDEE